MGSFSSSSAIFFTAVHQAEHHGHEQQGGNFMTVIYVTDASRAVGVATANSILVVSFCRERLAEHGDALKAALEAGYTRFRPVCMTALAMMIGMLPLALSEEQNAPLGRAVIGGLMLATDAQQHQTLARRFLIRRHGKFLQQQHDFFHGRAPG